MAYQAPPTTAIARSDVTVHIKKVFRRCMALQLPHSSSKNLRVVPQTGQIFIVGTGGPWASTIDIFWCSGNRLFSRHLGHSTISLAFRLKYSIT
jgi:hypothetical protein